jgi:thiopeptide-type bacteriocin biosynthesis protein
MLDMVTAFTAQPVDGWRWLLDHAPRTTTAAGRQTRTRAIALTGPDQAGQLSAQPGGRAVVEAWKRRSEPLAAYRDALLTHGVTDPTIVLPDLLHLHHVRVLGLSPDTERACLSVARAAALSLLARRTGAS